MMNPLEMNFYGTRNEESFANLEVLSTPSETTSETTTTSEVNQSNSLAPYEVSNQGDSNNDNNKADGIGKWIDPDKGKKPISEPYPDIPYLRKYSWKDKNLPKPLLDLFTPLKCNLCNCVMGSTATAKDHYDGRKHKASIRKWLSEHPEYNQEKKHGVPATPPKIMDPSKLYCKFCDLMLSSEQQAESHYLGKKHQHVVSRGIPKNAFFNPVKKQWERFSKGSTEGRFGIGLAFLQRNAVGDDGPTIQKLFCKTCQVACPNEVTFKEHLGGAKHKKKMAFLNRSVTSSAAKNNILGGVLKSDVKISSATDLSIYRTPSGKYYCQACNITVNSPNQFIQHTESRKHKNKIVLTMAKHPYKP